MDSWAIAIAQLQGAWPAPVVRWPADRCQLIMATQPVDDEPDIELEPESRCAVTDEVVLAHLHHSGATTVRTAAAELAIPKSTLARALQRMRDRGLVRRAVDGWRVA